MTSVIRVEGMDVVLRRIQAMVTQVPFRTMKGMIAAGLFIQRESQKLTPVDFGNLRASAFTVWSGGGKKSEPGFKGEESGELASRHASVLAEEGAQVGNSFTNPEVEVGFSAYYAIYVHENLNARHVTGEAQFLQKAMARNIKQIEETIRREAAAEPSK